MIKGRKIVCIIPARGKSKRLPGKNIMNFLGKPLIAHTILSAKKSKYIDDIYVTTDDEKIANVATLFGAKVIMRPDELATDISPTAKAISHALCNIKTKLDADITVTLQPTNPLRPDNLIDECITSFIADSETIDSLITVSINKYKLGEIVNDRYKASMYTPGQRSQDLKSYYYENGLVYITKSELIINFEDIFGKEIKPFVIDNAFAEVDIDTKEDFEWAELIGQKYFSNEQ